jgi:hypothetical protein
MRHYLSFAVCMDNPQVLYFSHKISKSRRRVEMTTKATVGSESFTSKYKAEFNEKTDEWVLQVPRSAVALKPNGFYEVRLPLYASRALAIGGNILRPYARNTVTGY